MGNSDMTITFGQTEVPEHSVCVWTDHLDKRSSEKLSRPFELLKSSAREAGAGGWHINDLMSGQLSRQLTFLSNEIASRWKSTHYPGTSNTKTNLYRPIILPKARAEIFIVTYVSWFGSMNLCHIFCKNFSIIFLLAVMLHIFLNI